jgi:hypothetical protein
LKGLNDRKAKALKRGNELADEIERLTPLVSENDAIALSIETVIAEEEANLELERGQQFIDEV